jgi:S-adenosylmethionine:tRNA ribosyltransferase-isomerase
MKMEVNVRDYTYNLPPDRIAIFPLEERDQSKLLVYQHGNISHDKFVDLPARLNSDVTLYFNNTKVIQARLHFVKASGAGIEVFLLKPVKPSALLLSAMQSTATCQWQCTIGNLKRWKEGTVLTSVMDHFNLEATLLDREEGLVEFRWTGDRSFAEVIDAFGETPLPPYLKRAPVEEDKNRYQTIYSRSEGAVAAPTAGLHFTPRVFDLLKNKGIQYHFLTLHVSAGTFQPVKVENAAEHVMHREQVIITRENLIALLDEKRFVIPVGTTSMRSLESLYWYGVKLAINPHAEFQISQVDAYTLKNDLPLSDALQNVQKKMLADQTDRITGETSIYIMPGYKFRVCRGLITNFHQPNSTLILLVAAFVGEDWRKIYDEALRNDYRFLSYGDSSLLLP